MKSDPMPRLRCLVLLVLMGADPALACEAPPSPQVFEIEHEFLGKIGTHTIEFRCAGDELVVATTVRITVELFFATAFEREAGYREVWRDRHLIRFRGRTIDNGRINAVSARRDGRRVLIRGQEGEIAAPAEIVPNHPWHPDVLRHKLAFDLSTGELLSLHAVPLGEDTVQIGGRRVTALKFVTLGDRRRELWYDEHGLLRWRLERRGAAITLSRRDLDS